MSKLKLFLLERFRQMTRRRSRMFLDERLNGFSEINFDIFFVRNKHPSRTSTPTPLSFSSLHLHHGAHQAHQGLRVLARVIHELHSETFGRFH